MSELCLKVLDGRGQTLAVGRGTDEACLVFTREYQEGDLILFQSSETGQYIWLQFDDALGKTLVYVTGLVFFRIPFGERCDSLSPKAFQGKKHLICARAARDFEIDSYRNLAVNIYDQNNSQNLYPHATANVETRDEAVFAARNAIDGITVTDCHGEWPYGSWGINRQDDAKFRIDFGTDVAIDRIILYTRADFPHDNWWNRVSFTFSDGSELDWELQKGGMAQEIRFEEKRVNWLEMHDMKKADDPSPFPALSQIEVYGRPCRTGS